MPQLRVRIPKQIVSTRVVYEKQLSILRVTFALLTILAGICLCSVFTLSVIQFRKTVYSDMTQVAVSKSTADMALTQTAIPTITLTPSSTVTLTPTQTYTPTQTLTPTVTPVFSWSKSTVDGGNNKPVLWISMDINKDGKYYLAYFLDQSDELMVVEGNGKVWKPIKNLSQLNKEGRSVGHYVTLDIEGSEFPYLAYLIYDKKIVRGSFLTSDGTWSTANVGQNLEALDIKISIDSSHIPHFVILTKNGDIYHRSSETNLVKVKTGVSRPSKLDVPSNFFPITLAIAPTKTPYICYSTLGSLECIHKTENSWIVSTVSDNGIYPSLQIDGNGNLHLAYYDYKEQSLKYAYSKAGNSAWNIYSVDATANVGIYPSIRVDTNNLVHISYYDADNTALKYAYGQLGGWSIYTIDNDGNVGLTSSLVLDMQNNPTIAYYDMEKMRIYCVTRSLK